MTSHGGWLEAGNAHAPTFVARLLCAWSVASAGSKALSVGNAYTFSSSGTVQGAFICVGSGAVATIDNTNGTLYSAGVLATPQPVIGGNVFTMNYSSTLA